MASPSQLLTPGARYLIKGLASLLVESTAAYGTILVLSRILNLNIPNYAAWVATVCVRPLRSFVQSHVRRFKERKEMKSLGAIEVPAWKGKWFGNMDLVLQLNEQVKTDYAARAFEKYVELHGTTWNMDILGEGFVFTLEPEHIKQVLATQFDNFEKGKEIYTAVHDVLGTGVFNSDGEMWKFHRSMTRPFFSKERISHFNLFERHADQLLSLMTQRIQGGHAVDVQDAFSRFTLDSATEFLFGSCVNSLDAGLPYPANVATGKTKATPHIADKFAQGFLEAQEVIAERTFSGPLWPLGEIFENKTTSSMKIVNDYINPILAAALEKKRSLSKTGSVKSVDERKADEIDDEETLLDHLVHFTDDQTILKDEILNIMIAGRDTTASALTFTTYLLAMHPKIASRLRQEILDKVGPTRTPTYDDIRDMKYLRAFINETLRLFPPVPFDSRRSKKGTTLAPASPGGKPFYIPAETGVLYCVLLMHRRTDLWGPDAMEFDPDRFLDERLHKYLIPNPYILASFNAGPRICLGQQFAYNEMSFMLIRLLQTFDRFELDATAQPPETIPPASWKDVPGRQSIERCWPKAHLTLYAYGGMWLKLHEASQD